MSKEQQGSKAAKILYRPWGLLAGAVAGLIASQLFQRVWKTVDPDSSDEAPTPLQSEYRMRKILVAAMLQGAIFSLVRALVDRSGARLFQRWTGEWPGD